MGPVLAPQLPLPSTPSLYLRHNEALQLSFLWLAFLSSAMHAVCQYCILHSLIKDIGGKHLGLSFLLPTAF